MGIRTLNEPSSQGWRNRAARAIGFSNHQAAGKLILLLKSKARKINTKTLSTANQGRAQPSAPQNNRSPPRLNQLKFNPSLLWARAFTEGQQVERTMETKLRNQSSVSLFARCLNPKTQLIWWNSISSRNHKGRKNLVAQRSKTVNKKVILNTS